MKQVSERKQFLSIFFVFAIFYFLSPSLLASDSLESPVLQKEKNCLHWGLSHWVSGISEYLEMSLCCNEKAAGYEGMYITVSPSITTNPPEQQEMEKYISGHRIEHTTNCYCLSNQCCQSQREVDPYGMICMAITCCPFISLGHLCCLPLALCQKENGLGRMERVSARASNRNKACIQYVELLLGRSRYDSASCIETGLSVSGHRGCGVMGCSHPPVHPVVYSTEANGYIVSGCDGR